MFFNKYNFLIKDFTDKANVRPEIAGIFVKPNETCATDSFTMIKVSSVKGFDVKDYPVLPHRPKIPTNFNPFILPSEKAQDLVKIVSKSKNYSLPILNNIVVMRRSKNDVELGATDLESVNSIQSRIIEGEYPRYNDIFVERGKYIEVSLNPDFLKKIASFYSSFSDKKGIVMRIPVNGESPIRFFGKRSDGQTAEALLMPIKG